MKLNTKNISDTFMLLLALGLGLFLGVYIKYAGLRVGSLWTGNFGQIGNGLFLWTALSTMIALHSNSKTKAALHVFAFLGSMVVSNYTYSFLVVHYFVPRVVLFWTLMLIPSALGAALIWDIKSNKTILGIPVRLIVLFVGTLIMLYDLFVYPFLSQHVDALMIVALLYYGFVKSIQRVRVL
ncbi:MAG: hypothetical protein GX845_03195 [Erysipelothrix sp.]|jgi:hypothetical protein|nr:hypothetical protein [Erysipelothrix sp.]